mmetsp:Transcript_40470/g.112416  ORF Transcript_40470/g.112416 Transcript_40470/m.112416 type:complete len:235 (-) Transcript_40470:297-1001(-)
MHSTSLAAAKRPLASPGRAAEAKATLPQSSRSSAMRPEVTRPAADTLGSGQFVLMIKAACSARPSAALNDGTAASAGADGNASSTPVAVPPGATAGAGACSAAAPATGPVLGTARAGVAVAKPAAPSALLLVLGFPAVRTRRKITATRRSQSKSDGSGKPCCHSNRAGPVSTKSDLAGTRTRTTGPAGVTASSPAALGSRAAAAAAPGLRLERPPRAKDIVASPSSEREQTCSS